MNNSMDNNHPPADDSNDSNSGRQDAVPGNAMNGDVHGGILNQFANVNNMYLNAPQNPDPEPARELPPATSPWVDRTAPLQSMTESIIDPAPRHGPRVLVVHGTDAIGKTAFVVKCAAPLEKEHFPDGSRYFDVKEATVDGIVSVHELLCGLLEALGDDPDKWPKTFGGLARRWRTLTANHRMLLVLDNLEDPAIFRQIQPNGKDITIVIVSRYNILDFVAMGAKPFKLEPLSQQHSIELLAEFCGRDRTDAEPEVAAELADICQGRPQLIRVIGASLMSAPGKTLAECVSEIVTGAGPVADHIKVATKAIVAYSLSHNVSDEERGLLKALSRFPGRDFSTALASWLNRADAADLLNQLTEAQLIISAGPARWRLASAIGDYDFGDDSNNTLDLILDWYLRSARLCDEQVMGAGRLRIHHISDTSSPLLFRPENAATASHWLFTEQHAMFKLQRLAFDSGRYNAVWAMEEALWVLYQNYQPFDLWQLTAPLAVQAAVLDNNLDAEARMRDQYVNLLLQLGRLDEAATEAETAVEVARRAGNRRLEASAIEFQGMVHKHRGEFRTAIDRFTAALAVNEELGLERASAIQRRLIGECQLALGDLNRARIELTAALATFTAGKSTHHTGHTLGALAQLDALTGDVDATRTTLAKTEEALTAAGATGYIPKAYEACGDALSSSGSAEAARQLWTTALEYHQANHNGESDAAARLQEKLTLLPQ